MKERHNWQFLYKFIRKLNIQSKDVFLLEDDFDQAVNIRKACRYYSLSSIVKLVEYSTLVDPEMEEWLMIKSLC
jgi:hypothetical protein